MFEVVGTKLFLLGKRQSAQYDGEVSTTQKPENSGKYFISQHETASFLD